MTARMSLIPAKPRGHKPRLQPQAEHIAGQHARRRGGMRGH